MRMPSNWIISLYLPFHIFLIEIFQFLSISIIHISIHSHFEQESWQLWFNMENAKRDWMTIKFVSVASSMQHETMYWFVKPAIIIEAFIKLAL